ncbi:hypothetical protein M9Y10_023897 [Tritrichomonas musculus]|uniref:Calponin-homology (CH) domain-containing protein n=1 Tax=Tritrichomonas musculus TaxID=1915356 RepID=A0ABR2KWE0_9EUKA
MQTEINSENLSLQQLKVKSWAVQRTQTYPKVLGFKPYDLAICALLDFYYPRKINYYMLNLEDHQKNLQLANDVMKELGIQVMINSSNVSQIENEADQKTILEQLELVQKVIDKKEYKETLSKDNNQQKLVPNELNTEAKFEEQIKKDKEAYAKHSSESGKESTEKKVARLFK